MVTNAMIVVLICFSGYCFKEVQMLKKVVDGLKAKSKEEPCDDGIEDEDFIFMGNVNEEEQLSLFDDDGTKEINIDEFVEGAEQM